jgi:hypothetical protein
MSDVTRDKPDDETTASADSRAGVAAVAAERAVDLTSGVGPGRIDLSARDGPPDFGEPRRNDGSACW